jgi:hypothetical protein
MVLRRGLSGDAPKVVGFTNDLLYRWSHQRQGVRAMPTVQLDHAAVQDLLDERAVSDLLSRLGRWLDGLGGDPADFYDPEVVARSPRGEFRGIADIVARVVPSADDPERTQHFFTDVAVRVDGDRAIVEAKQLVQFFVPGAVPHRTSGLHVRYELARRAGGWRIIEADNTLAWLIGDLPT